MAKVKALTSFAGTNISMYPGEERDIEDKTILDDLLQAGHVELVDSEPVKKSKSKKGDK